MESATHHQGVTIYLNPCLRCRVGRVEGKGADTSQPSSGASIAEIYLLRALTRSLKQMKVGLLR